MSYRRQLGGVSDEDEPAVRTVPHEGHKVSEKVPVTELDRRVPLALGDADQGDFIHNEQFVGQPVGHSGEHTETIIADLLLPPPEPLSCDDEIRRCNDNDFDSLFELQKKYIVKEVAPANKQVSDLECSASLKQILKNQLCFALYSDGEVVAKANTNAIGIHWVQLGGVYTHPLYRKNYYAWNLVYAICGRIKKTNRKVCLFVKDKNNPALQLYHRIGFTEKCDFEICYF